MEEKNPDQSTTQPPPATPVAPQPASSPLPQNIYPSPRHFPKKAIIIITFLFIILLIFGTTWAFKDQIFQNNQPAQSIYPSIAPTSQPAAKKTIWKTYTSEKYGFEFRYPDSLIVSDIIVQPSGSVELRLDTNIHKSDGQCKTTGGSFYINLNNFNFVDGTNLLDQLTNFEEKYFAADEKQVLRSVTKIGDKPAKTFTYSGPSNVSSSLCNLVKGEVLQKIFLVTDEGTDYKLELRFFSEDKNLQNDFVHILTSFKFTEPNFPDTTLDFKTYRNQEIGISFNYSSDMTLTEEHLKNVSYINLKNGVEDIRIDIESSSSQNLLSKDPPVRQETYGDFQWNYQKSFNYCDAGNCGETAPGYYVKTNGKLISINLFKQSNSSLGYKKILETFSIL